MLDKTAGVDISADAVTQKTMRPRQFFGDAITVVSTNIIINIAYLISYFYTDVIGLAAGTVGTVLLLSKLFDAFTDVGMGVIVDRTKSKYGKARPWLIRMAVPSLLSIVLIFTIPPGISAGLTIVYVAVTNISMLAVVYTAITIPAGSLLALETNNPHERAKMGISRLIFAYIAGTSVTSLMLPAANSLGGGQRAWIIMGLVFGLVSAATLAVAFLCVKENNNVRLREEDEKIPPLKGLGFLFKNKYWVIALALNVLIQLIYAMGVSETYYMKYIFGNENLVAVVGLYRLLFVAVGFVLSGLLLRRLGKRNLVLIGVIIAILGYLLRVIYPYNFTLNLVTIGLCALGGLPLLAVIGAMIADTIEYGEWKTGKRTVGLAASANSFAGKLGSAFFAGAAGWLLGLSGYNGMLPVQPPMANKMIMILNIHIPLICYGVIFVLMMFYNLDNDYGRIIAELEARRKIG